MPPQVVSNPTPTTPTQSSVAAKPLDSVAITKLGTKVRAAPEGDVSKPALIAGMLHGDAKGNQLHGDPLNPVTLAKIDPKLAQAVLDNNYQTMADMMESWSKEEAKLAKEDKKASQVHEERSSFFERVRVMAQARADAAAGAPNPQGPQPTPHAPPPSSTQPQQGQAPGSTRPSRGPHAALGTGPNVAALPPPVARGVLT